VPPLVCIFLQISFYGFSFNYNGVALSALIVFLYVQNQDVFTDYLTGVANRKKLEYHFKKMINSSIPDKTFSAIMIDLDNFKSINDTLGHKAGDTALQTAAELLKSCIGKQDFIARYGGDEFCIVLDTSDTAELENTVKRIKTSIENYKTSSNQPYKMGLSMGYAIYQYGTVVDDFENMIDKLMYENKHNDYLNYL
jgi:diguanylate cyclase (GGDEF)-like protein